MGKTVISPLGLKAGSDYHPVRRFLEDDQNLKEPAELSKGLGGREGKESPFIWIRAGIRAGYGVAETLAVSPGEALFSMFSDMKAGDRS